MTTTADRQRPHTGSVPTLRPAAPEALVAVTGAIDQLLAADLTLPGDTDILDLLRGIETAARRLHTASLAVITQISTRGLAAPAGATSTAALLRQLLPLTAGDAHQRVRLAAAATVGTALTGQPLPPPLPILAAALHAGSIGAANAATIVSTLNGFPADVPPDVRESVEEFLVEQAAVLDPKTLHNVARRIALMANPDGPYDERDAADKQQFHIGARRDDGLTRCWGLLDDLTVEALRAALGALCAPAADRHPTPDTTPGSSTAPDIAAADEPGPGTPAPQTATADPAAAAAATDPAAAAAAADPAAAAADQAPTEATEPPVTEPPVTESDALDPPAQPPTDRQPWRPTRPPYEWAPLGTLPGDYPNHPPGPPPGDQPPDPPPPPDRRSAATRRAHALATILTAFLGSGAAPTIHGEKPHLLVTVSENDLRNRLGHAHLGYGDTIAIAAARMLACDAAVIPAVLRGPTEIIDIGRAMRTFTAACRKAILLRDIGCVFPGCSMPGAFCDNHHIRHWANGGPSNLDNAALLCRRHHTLIHHGAWQIRLGPDRTPELIPPTTHDPAQRPLRNTLHRPPAYSWPTRPADSGR